MILTHPKVEMLPMAVLTPNPGNARKHPQKQIMQLAANIRRFGFPVPVIVDQNNMIIAGHGRVEAAKKLGLKEVPVVQKAFLDDNERRAFALADNRLAELSSWDEDMLQSEITVLFESGFDISEIGFSTADLDFSIVEPEEPASSRTETVELPLGDTNAVTRRGDLWLIRDHRLYCGDARQPEAWEALLGNERADILFADPPYNVPINGHVSGTGRHREFAFASGEMSPPEFTHFLRGTFRNCVRFSRSGSIHYICMDWRHMRELLDAADGVFDQFKQLIVWDKGNGAMGSFYRSQHELVFVFKSGKTKHTNTFGLGENGRYRTNVLQYPGCNTFRKGREADLAAHSTVKPTAMVVDFLLDCSNVGDLLVDPYLGSGTSLLAAHKAKRRGAGIEIDPSYVDTALNRLKAISGIEPILAHDGRSFAEISEERINTVEG